MNPFIASLEPLTTVRLDGFDNCNGVINMPFYFWYEKTVPPNVLETAFYKAMEKFPILAGRVITGGDSRTYVEIDKNRLNMPVYTDSSCHVHFQTLRNADLDVKLLSVDYTSLSGFAAPTGIIGNHIKLAEIHALRMASGSGMCIFASISHAPFDGTAFCYFMKYWADISIAILASRDKHDACEIDLPERVFQLDRSVLETNKPCEMDALDPEFCKAIDRDSLLFSWLTWFSPELRGRLLNGLMSASHTASSYVHLPSSTLEHLTKEVLPFIESGIPRLSANDMVTALITVLFAQALDDVGGLADKTDFVTVIAANMRPRVKRLAGINYAGNSSILCEVFNPLTPMLNVCDNAQNLAAITCNVRRLVDKIDESYCDQVGYLINKTPCSYANMSMRIITRTNFGVVSNLTRVPFYDVDFGTGSSSLVRPSFLVTKNAAFIMPECPGVGSIDIAFFTAPKIENSLSESGLWQYFSWLLLTCFDNDNDNDG